MPIIKNLLKSPFIFILFVISLLTVYTFCVRFYLPIMPNVTIKISPVNYNAELQQISFSLDYPIDDYYFLVYEESLEQNWLYFNLETYNNLEISRLFVPDYIEKYVLFEGDKTVSEFHFDIQSKYALSYMATKEYIFHLQLIVPYRFWFFPVFYYTTHYTFYVEPLI
ncbi:MAG: hypothetical protein ATN35_10320 [Epulopiscium sp. Nele67-Bin004]|nr:MAG: hypothetical protein ATN35_10320 [Epulopiscium sp. Nele67-Bin004]